jgi:Na+/H+ antiporter NhaD/arsenite permease-like protein
MTIVRHRAPSRTIARRDILHLTVILFCFVYVALAIGHLPGFRLDRVGAVLVGAMLLVASGRISPAAAWDSIDYRTVGLLFGLMVISSAFSVAGFYDRVAVKVGGLDVSPGALLAVLIAVTGGLSALLTNDVVAVAMTPVLVSICLSRGLNPVPFLLGFCFATNVGAAATLIGSPQNMIAAEAMHLSFAGFMKSAALPAVLGLPLIWCVLFVFYRGRWHADRSAGAAHSAAHAAGANTLKPPVATRFDVFETSKAALVTLGVIVAFMVTDWPHVLIALAGASLLLMSRRVASKDLLREVDGNLLLLIMGLFVVNTAMSATGIPERLLTAMRDMGLDLHDPMSMLLIMTVLSNVVGNNPAVMLVAPFMEGASDRQALGAAISLGTGFSSNAFVFCSLAGIIVVEEGRQRGVAVSFGEFARVGIPVALLCLLLAGAWIAFLGMK